MQMTLTPLSDQNGNKHYCVYNYELTQAVDVGQLTNLSPEASSAILSTCFKLRSALDFHSAVEDVIHDIRDLTDAHHCCIFLTDFAQRKCSVLCEALREGTNLLPMGEYVNDDFIDIAATWLQTLGDNDYILVNSEDGWAHLKNTNPLWHDSLKNAGGRNIVMFPLKARDVILGFIWAINFDVSQSVRIMETLKLTTFFVASEIANYQLLHRMEVLSTTDLLTGIYNRNAMNNRVDRLLSGEDQAEQVGIVFADLNGLKQINDNDGHFAGDMLLKNAAITLQMAFEGCEVYRAGGDEFMVLITDLTQEDMEQRVQELREHSDDPKNVSFALGCCMDTTENIRRSMRLADERMYEDKERFYAEHPVWKRD
jgi:diguanylate cyclase (GGDEF)-like protein